MTPLYIPADAKLTTSIIDADNTTKHYLDSEVQDCLMECLQENYLDVYFTIPTQTQYPQVSDINAIFIHDWSGVILAEERDLGGLDADAIQEKIKQMVEALGEHNYLIELAISDDESTNNKSFNIGAKTMLDAIRKAFYVYLEATNHLLPANISFDMIESKLLMLATEAKPLDVTLEGTTYALKSAVKLDPAIEVENVYT